MPPWVNANPLSVLGLGLLCGFLFVLNSRVFDLYLWYLHVPLILSLLSLVAALLAGDLRQALTCRAALFLLGFTAWLTMAVPFSSWRGGSFNVLSDWLKSLLVFFLIASLVRTVQQGMRAIRLVAYAILTLGILAVAKHFYILGRLALPVGYYQGNPNELGFAMLAGLFFAWFIGQKPNAGLIRKILVVLAMALCLYVLAKTGSRAAMIGLMAVIPMWALRYSLAGRIRLIGAAFVFLLALPLVVPADILARYLTLFSSQNEAADAEMEATLERAVGSSEGRLELLKKSLKITIQHPVFGVGPGMFMLAESRNAALVGKSGKWLGTHNTYTQISSECGIPALVLFLGAMFCCWRELRQAAKLNRLRTHPAREEIDAALFSLQLCFLCYAVLFFFAHLGYGTLFPVLAGLIMALARAVKREVEAVPAPAPVAVPAAVRAAGFGAVRANA